MSAPDSQAQSPLLRVHHFYFHERLDKWQEQHREPREGETVEILTYDTVATLLLSQQIVVKKDTNWIDYDLRGRERAIERGRIHIYYDEPFDDKKCWKWIPDDPRTSGWVKVMHDEKRWYWDRTEHGIWPEMHLRTDGVKCTSSICCSKSS